VTPERRYRRVYTRGTPEYRWDLKPGPEGMEALFPQPLTLVQWLDRWVNGSLYQRTLVQDSLTQARRHE
jgi:hypothetical protein